MLSRLLPVVAGSALLLSACTGDPAPPAAFPLPAASSFAPGTCELVAPDVLALGRAARALGDGPTAPDTVKARFTEAQKALQTVAGTAEPALAPLLDAVVARAGLVRIALDAERYEPATADPLRESYAALVDACTGRGAPATPTATTG